MTTIPKNPSPARPASNMNGGGTSSMPDELILVKYQAAPKLPTPDIRQISRKKIVARSHLICCSSSLMSNTSFMWRAFVLP
jgi:hypothetical protein